MRKRVLTIALVLIIMVSLLAFHAFAEDATRSQCVCGGKAVGKTGHTCENITFEPWTSTTSLPKSGNYYLTDDVTITNYHLPTGELNLDLNGCNITRKLTGTSTTQVIAIANSYGLSITDSTANPGTISRDLSALTDAQKTSITNWGLCIIVNKGYTGALNLYDGIYDSTACYSGGGSVISNSSVDYPVNIYGGELKGGISPQGVIYSVGAVSIMGGKISGGVTTNTGSSAMHTTNGLTLGGDAQITGNTYSDGTAANILLAHNLLTIKGTFTGNVSITPSSTLTLDEVFGAADNAAIQGTITLEGYPNYSLDVIGSDLVVNSSYKIMAVIGMNTTYYNSLEEAIEEYQGDKSILKLLGDASEEEITITQDTYIDLNGHNIGGVDVTGGTLYLYDSQTDDYTINDSRGYGKVKKVKGDVQALPSGELFKNGYLMITETDGTSFHRLSVDTTGVALRATDIAANGAAIYYQSGFGGDEVVKQNVQAFGIAMGAGKTPDFRAKSFTRNTNVDALWETGKLNTFNGTLLKNIMKTGNSYTINNRNSSMQVYSQAYVELVDGTKIMGGSYNLSLKQIMEGTETSTGIDGLWETLQDNQKQPVIDMFNQFQDVMSGWKIPYIKHEITGEEIPYEDDGILRVLLIGHSLGLDSGYFFPEVYKEATGKDVVVGMLYHSGCRLTQHVGYINGNSKQYIYHEFDTRVDKEWRIANAISTEGAAMTFHYIAPNGALEVYDTSGVTMKDGIARADWDVVVMQAGVYEAAGIQESAAYQAEIINDVKTIQAHVLENDIEKRSTPKFAWNITWSCPSSDASFWDSNADYVNLYKNRNQSYYWQYGKDANDMYADIAATYQTKVSAAYTWDYLMPSGTALHNAKSLMADELLYRDVVHTNDFGRLMAAYIWTCQLEGKTMDDFDGVTSIYSKLRFNTADRNAGDYVLNSNEQAVLIKAVNAALANPLTLTDLAQ